VTRLLGKLAVVTGGSSGIGRALAVALAREGAAVVSMARRFPTPAPSGAPAIRPDAGQIAEVQLDVTDEAMVRDRFAALGSVDLLLCSAGVGYFAPVHTAEPADLRAMLDVHVMGTFLCAREALRGMQARRSGHIVAIGSHVAHRSFPECSGYTAAKAGQLGLMRVIAEEARPYQIRVTTVMPGATDTPIWDDRPGFDRSKMMKPEDVAGFVVAIIARPAISVDEVTVMPPAGAL
jgi:NAD(P)-dependent dehydrogenase (short-subunit alcohol dehydrogenase family)